MRLRKSFLLILVASALLLSAAKNAAEEQRPRPAIHRETPLSKKRKGQATATQADTISPSPTPVIEPTKPAIQPPVADNRAAEIQQDSQHKKLKEFDRLALGNMTQTILQFLFTAITTIATVYLAKFTYRLVSVTKDLHLATEASTQAANKTADAAQAQLDFTKAANEQNTKIASENVKAAQLSAHVAELAHTAGRPYLVVEKAKVLGVIRRTEKPTKSGGLLENTFQILTLDEQLNEPSEFFPSASITFKNYGKGVAIIEEIVALISLVSAPPEEHDFSDCHKLSIEREAVGPSGEWIESRIHSLEFLQSQTTALWHITNKDKTLIVYGRVKYRDVAGTEPEGYYTEFYWFFEPPRPFGTDLLTGKPLDPKLPNLRLPHSFSRGSQARNERT
jgi:hypothetical protein